MINKVSQLKENQQLLGDKMNRLLETNKKKDTEAEKIRALIVEYRQNLNRMKKDLMNDEPKIKCSESNRNEVQPCLDKSRSVRNQNCSGRPTVEDHCSKIRQQQQPRGEGRWKSVCGASVDPCEKIKDRSSPEYQSLPPEQRKSCPAVDPCADPCAKFLTPKHEPEEPCKAVTDKISAQVSALASAQEISRQCIEYIGEEMERKTRMRISNNVSFGRPLFDTSECGNNDAALQERVSCKVDLRNMRVNLKSTPEDLMKLDAVQLVNLLDKYQCQELVINTAVCHSSLKEPGKEISIFYLLHPGNLVLTTGILMLAFLINSNLCDPCRGYNTKMLLAMLYVSSLAFHCGTILWMSFIRGLTLRTGLSREMFHSIDNLLLPKYFAICVFLSATTLYSFLASHCETSCTSWSLPVLLQVVIKSITFVTELIAICYIVPAIIKLRNATDDHCDYDDLNPPTLTYCKNLEKLARLDRMVSVINAFTVLFMGSNIFYITSNLRLE